jgi:pyrrolidone-carboxylate peptidase
MKILVTAFGLFDGRAENASSLALHEIRKALSNIHTRILPVDSVIAPARLKQALRVIRPDILILLGESAGSRSATERAAEALGGVIRAL